MSAVLYILAGAIGTVAMQWVAAWLSRWQSEHDLHASKASKEFDHLRNRLEQLHRFATGLAERTETDCLACQRYLMEKLAFNPGNLNPKFPGSPDLSMSDAEMIVEFYARDLRRPLAEFMAKRLPYLEQRAALLSGKQNSSTDLKSAFFDLYRSSLEFKEAIAQHHGIQKEANLVPPPIDPLASTWVGAMFGRASFLVKGLGKQTGLTS